ncbi:MAG: hypothetical protein AABX70_08375 [Nanoarchaeota archaeon]
MQKIVYTAHLELRLKIRKIPYGYPTRVCEEPDQTFYDQIEGNHIAIKKLKYGGKIRNMMIAYEEKDDSIEIITIHPITDEKIINRTLNERWTKHE